MLNFTTDLLTLTDALTALTCTFGNLMIAVSEWCHAIIALKSTVRETC